MDRTRPDGRVQAGEPVIMPSGVAPDRGGPQRLYVQGTQGADTLTGTEDRDEIQAFGGNDVVHALGGDDFVNGGDGDDQLFGGDGNDTLLGGGGADVIDGGAGDDFFDQDADSAIDRLIGGSGADRFMLHLYNPTSTAAFTDVIADFSTADGDRLDLRVNAGTYVRFNDPLSGPLREGDTAPGGASGAIDIWTWTEGGLTYLFVDRNGNERLDATDVLVAFEGQPQISRESFVAGTFSVFYGTPGNDVWTGGAGGERYFAEAGDDLADGAGGDDELFGAEGNDTLNGGDGDDYLVGEEGSDTLRGGDGDDTLYAAFHRNTSRTDAGSTNRLFGEGGNDILVGGDGKDIMDGGAGDDVFDSRADDSAVGGDEMYGGAGNDYFRLEADFADGGAGDDYFYLGQVGSTVAGGSGADVFRIYAGVNTPNLASGTVNLILDFSLNELDRLDYSHLSSGNANLGFRGAVDNAGFDLIWGARYSSNDDLTTGVGQMWTWFDGTYTWLMTDVDLDGRLSAPDYFLAFLGQPSIKPNAFTEGSLDSLMGTMDADQWSGTDDHEVFYGLAGNDTLDGSGGADELYGGAGDDSLHGGTNNDVLDGGTGRDRMYGGAGNDHYIVDTQADLIFENADEGYDRVTASTGFYLYDGVEELTLSSDAGDTYGVGNGLDNYLVGNSGANLLLGGEGHDTLLGGSGNDSLFGEAGDDRLFGDDGIDFLVGGDGNDVLKGGVGADALYGGNGDDILWGGGSFDTDILVGGEGNDILRGDSRQADYDLLDGDAGDDLYWVDTGDDLTFEDVGGGNDTVYADVRVPNAGVYLYANVENLILVGTTAFGVGNDLDNLMVGSSSDNWLLGGDGDDVMTGGAGNDVLFGEAGADVFVFERGTGGDVIGDFTSGEDRIDLRDHGFTSFEQIAGNFGQVASDGAINLRNGDVIILHDVTMADLTAADFIFLGQDSPADGLTSLIPSDDPRFNGWSYAPPAESGDRDAGAQVLPGLGEDDFIVGKAVLETTPQVLPGADGTRESGTLPDGVALKMAIWADLGDGRFLPDTFGADAVWPETDWGWA
ncbi:MAG: hypothetical protein KKF88_11405 [Alphaproteobacteria bacterium]|nr:hypothetical protein [Alphaproteobacteria bacterium]